MVKKVFSKKMTIVIFIFIFFITNVSYNLKAFAEDVNAILVYSNVKAVPEYGKNGSWVKIYQDPSGSSNLRTDYDNGATVYTDLVDLIQLLITNNKNNIYIMNGDYKLSKTLEINKTEITILGETDTDNNIKTKLVLDPSPPSPYNCIRVSKDNVQIANLNIDGSASGASEMIHAQNINGFNITNCRIKGSGDGTTIAFYGNNTSLSSDNVISGSIIEEGTGTFGEPVWFLNQKSGVLIGNTVSHGWIKIESCDGVSIDSNTSNDSIKQGIYLEGSSKNISIINNTINRSKESGIDFKLPGENINIKNNTINNAKGSGIYTHGSDATYRANNFNIDNNTINNTEYIGININNLYKGKITNNTINTPDFHGIYAIRSDNLDIENNTILNCERWYNITPPPPQSPKWGSPIKAAMYLETDITNSTIRSNILYNPDNECEYGIYMTKDIQNNLYNNIWSNSISGKFQKLVWANISNLDYTNILEKDAVTDNSISLKWTGLISGTTYTIRRVGDNKEVYSGPNLTCIDTGLAPNIDYYYQISIDGDGKWSSPIKVTTLFGSPDNFRIGVTTEGSIQLLWDAESPSPIYSLEADNNPLSDNIKGGSYIHGGLSSDSTHHYRLRRENGQWSAPITGTTLPSKTPEDIIPQNLRVVATTESSIQIAWDEVNSSAEYDVEADGNIRSLGKDESYEDIGLLSSTTHKYRVRIKNGKWSEYIFANTLGSQTPGVLIPQNIRATSTKNTITINWDEIDPSTEYEIEVDGENISVDTNEKYKHKGLKSNSKHRYRVRVKGGEWSPVLIVKTYNSTSSSSSKETRSENSNNENDEFDKVEIYFGNKRNFIYGSQLIGNTKVDILNRLFICKFEENYYLGIRAWKNNEVKIETEYKVNLTPGNILTFNKLENKFNEQSYQINEISVQGTDENLFYASDFENITLSKYIIGNGYMIWFEDIEIKIKENEKYTTSKSFII